MKLELNVSVEKQTFHNDDSNNHQRKLLTKPGSVCMLTADLTLELSRTFTFIGFVSTQKFILMHNPSRVFTVIQEDVPAANGIIHIIDQPITSLPAARAPPDEQVGGGSLTNTLSLPVLVDSY